MTSLITEPSKSAPPPHRSVPRTDSGESAYQDDLSAGRIRACVWGLGHIGWSTVEALSEADVAVVSYDVNPARVADRRGTRISTVRTAPALRVTTARDEALADDVTVHFIAVPTERGAEPYTGALLDVFASIVAATGARPDGTAPLVIIESTVPPGTIDTLLLPALVQAGLVPDEDLLLALAPRRDWFLAEGYGLRELDRVYCGIGPRSADAAHRVLSLMCDTLHRAPGHLEGELVKCVENAYRHLEITLANQLTVAYPQVDMVEVLRLVGTKWNIGTFHPSFGTGGYCIPLSSRYLLHGAEHAEELSLLSQAVETDMRMRTLVAEAVGPGGPVLILGLAYKGGIKVSTLSPTVRITDELRRLGTEVTVHDPLYSEEQIEAVLGPGSAATDLAEAVRLAATVLVVPDHTQFLKEPYLGLLRAERGAPLLVLDNHGVWADQQWPSHVVYRRAGQPRWLVPLRPDTTSQGAGDTQ